MRVLGVDPWKDYRAVNNGVVHVSTAWRARLAEVVHGGAEMTFEEVAAKTLKHVLAEYEPDNTAALVATSGSAGLSAPMELVDNGHADAAEGAIVEASPRLQWLQKRLETLTRLLDVQPHWRVSSVSAGQRARIQLVLQLLPPRRLILLDEVTAELDLAARQNILAFLVAESLDPDRRVSVIYATHVLEGLDAWPTHILHLCRSHAPKLQPWPPANPADLGPAATPALSLYDTALNLLLEERDRALAAGASLAADDGAQNDEQALGTLTARAAQARDPSLPPVWTYRTNILPGGFGSHIWGSEAFEEGPGPSHHLEDELYVAMEDQEPEPVFPDPPPAREEAGLAPTKPPAVPAGQNQQRQASASGTAPTPAAQTTAC